MGWPISVPDHTFNTAFWETAPPVKPLIVLIGWLGAKERYFAKYIQLWQAWGYQTVSIRPPTASILLPPYGDVKAHAFAEQVAAVQQAAPHRPTVYHIFSNAGFLFFGTMLRAIAASDDELRALVFPSKSALSRMVSTHLQPNRRSLAAVLEPVTGVVLDSAPSRITPDIAARGFTSAVLGKPAEGIEEVHPRIIAASRGAFRPVLQCPLITSRVDEVWRAWQTVAPRAPQLYLHSSNDALIPPAEVHRFIDMQRQRGVEVCHKEWLKSPHCEHYRRYPDEYKAELQAFLKALPTR
ncbi:hypothetical protein WJX72_006171 [[Myrmecia] bisecta]|uniref:Uncharacterized protein n=1 Tax=[Myrmecia] bisecta TaxID=41462 RepID=A0AAW1QQT5_9CHLO